MSKPITFNISSAAIFKVVFVLLILASAWLIRDIIAIFFVALILAAVIFPAVEFFGKWKIPPWAAVLIVYIIIVSVLSLAVILLVPVFVNQIIGVATEFPAYYQRIQGGIQEFQNYSVQYNLNEEIKKLFGPIGKAGQGIITSIFGIFGGFISILVILVLTFYMLVEKGGLEKFISHVTPDRYHKYVVELITRMQRRVGLWIRGQLILMFAVSILTFIGLLILRVPYAALLAFLMFVLEIIPIAGPIIGGVVAAVLTFLATKSLLTTVLVILLFIIIQQLENQILLPRVMSRVVGLSPIVVILAILIGAKVAGIVGALLAVPVATALSVFVKDWKELRKELPEI